MPGSALFSLSFSIAKLSVAKDLRASPKKDVKRILDRIEALQNDLLGARNKQEVNCHHPAQTY
ncbi:type II toxin-antitoxin system RelE family toxin [Wenzhouxiangella limi]|uniref:Uncharacterized protein n=1 Tax=Wenzhouxiangella limi TaxID=2707351 RepID=A0A845V3E8_9GAMM|nr:hypothetical protein [Wenzhouxiangella limi]NDY94771.1 hypothetical protein [Wenzhouxiangella limi]